MGLALILALMATKTTQKTPINMKYIAMDATSTARRQLQYISKLILCGQRRPVTIGEISMLGLTANRAMSADRKSVV